MEIVISGYIVAVLPCEQGTSQRTGQPWMKQGYVLQHEQGQYPKHICFEIFGQDKIQQMAIQYGEYLTVHLNADAHEDSKKPGKWYNELRCWRIDRMGQQMQPGQQMPTQGGYPPQQPMMAQPQYSQQPQYPPQQPQYPPQQPMAGNPFPPQQPPQNPFPPQQPAPAAAPAQPPFPPAAPAAPAPPAPPTPPAAAPAPGAPAPQTQQPQVQQPQSGQLPFPPANQ